MSSLIHQGRASYAFFERNWNLTKRYWAWEIVWLVYNIVNALAVTFIGAAAQDLPGTNWYAVAHGMLFTFIQLFVVGAFFHLDLSHANYLTAVFMLLAGSVSFIGFGIAASALPLLFTERGSQMSYIVRAVLLLVSGVYYPVSVLPGWMQPLARISPATYVLQGLRAGLLENKAIWSPEIWSNTWPLIITGIVSIPLGVFIFRIAERYAKRSGKLKRNG